MGEKTKQYMKMVVFTAVVFGIVLYLEEALQLLAGIYQVFSPAVTGLMIAFVLNVPMKGIERLIKKIDSKNKCGKSFVRIISITLTFIIIIAVIVLAVALLIPNLVSTVGSLVELIQVQLPVFAENLQKEFNLDLENITVMIQDFVKNFLQQYSGDFAGITTAVTGTFSRLFSFVLGLIVGIYVLAGKEFFGSRLKRVIDAFVPEKRAQKIYYVGKLVNDTYAKFLSGQCLEAVIIAVLITVALSIFRIPYAALIGVLSGVLSFIPYVGSFVACFAGAFFILIESPLLALAEIIIFQVVQFIEGQIIYPRVVGKSVGLPALFTLLAAIIGGNLFGVLGMIFFIPVAAVLYELLKEVTRSRLEAGEKDKAQLRKE